MGSLEEKGFKFLSYLLKAPTDGKYWEIFFEELQKELHAVQGYLHWANLSTGEGKSLTGEAQTKEYLQGLSEYYLSIDPYLFSNHKSLFSPGCIAVGQELVPDDVLIRTEFYNDFFKNFDLFHLIGGTLTRTEDTITYFSIERAKKIGMFTKEEVDLIQLLLPHMQQAVTLSGTIKSVMETKNDLQKSLDIWPYAIFNLNKNRKITHLNTKAAAMLKSNNIFRVESKELQLILPQENVQFQTKINQAMDERGLGPRGSFFRTKGLLDKTHYNIFVWPIQETELWEVSNQKRMMVLVKDTSDEHIPNEMILKSSYGLTPREANTLQLLIKGFNSKDMAKAMGTSEHTIRSHMKNIMEKMNVTRQLDLVRKVFNDFPCCAL